MILHHGYSTKQWFTCLISIQAIKISSSSIRAGILRGEMLWFNRQLVIIRHLWGIKYFWNTFWFYSNKIWNISSIARPFRLIIHSLALIAEYMRRQKGFEMRNKVNIKIAYQNIAVDSVELNFYLVNAFDYESLCLFIVERSLSPSLLSYYVWWYMTGSYWVALLSWTDSYAQVHLIGILKIKIKDRIQFVYTWPNRSRLRFVMCSCSSCIDLDAWPWIESPYYWGTWNTGSEVSTLMCVGFVCGYACNTAEEDLVKFGTSVNYRVFVSSHFWNVNITQL